MPASEEIEEERVGDESERLDDPGRMSLMVLGPFSTKPYYRCEYQFTKFAGSIFHEEDRQKPLWKGHEGTKSAMMYRMMTGIAEWLTLTQQRFLETRRLKNALLNGNPVPWYLEDFAKEINLETDLGLIRRAIAHVWIFWPDCMVNLKTFFASRKPVHKSKPEA